nr:unnamed protein product [Spirometra erinaceieuropaei]
MAENIRLKRAGASTHPCFTPLVNVNASETAPLGRDSRHHSVVQLTHHLIQTFRTAEFLHDLPQSFTIHRVEGFRQVHEVRVQVDPHLLALLLKLTGGEDHIRGPTNTTEDALAFLQKVQFQMVIDAVEKYASG